MISLEYRKLRIFKIQTKQYIEHIKNNSDEFNESIRELSKTYCAYINNQEYVNEIDNIIKEELTDENFLSNLKQVRVESPDHLYVYGRVELLLGNYKEAEFYIKKASFGGHIAAKQTEKEIDLLSRDPQKLVDLRPNQYETAVKYLILAADKGNCEAQIKLGEIYSLESSYQDIDLSISYLTKAATQENSYAMYQLSLIFSRLKLNIDQGNWWLIEAAEYGNIQAMYDIGCVLEKEQKQDLAKEFFEKALSNGSIEAGNKLGLYWYQKGKIDLAKQYFIEAVNKGSIYSQINLGKIFEEEKNYEQALLYYSQSAENNRDLQEKLGQWYLEGKHIKQDYNKAKEWLEKALKLKSTLAKFFLAKLYIVNTELEERVIKAYKYIDEFINESIVKKNYWHCVDATNVIISIDDIKNSDTDIMKGLFNNYNKLINIFIYNKDEIKVNEYSRALAISAVRANLILQNLGNQDFFNIYNFEKKFNILLFNLHEDKIVSEDFNDVVFILTNAKNNSSKNNENAKLLYKFLGLIHETYNYSNDIQIPIVRGSDAMQFLKDVIVSSKEALHDVLHPSLKTLCMRQIGFRESKIFLEKNYIHKIEQENKSLKEENAKLKSAVKNPETWIERFNKKSSTDKKLITKSSSF